MSNPVFLTRVVLRNYKSIGDCDLRLNPLTYLVGDHPGISSDGCADGSRRRAQADRADGNPDVPPGDGRSKTSVAIAGAEHVRRYAASAWRVDCAVPGKPGLCPITGGYRGARDGAAPAASAALREALARASQDKQVIVTSHRPDLLDDLSLSADALLAVVSEGGATRIAPLDEAARMAMRDQLFSAGELPRLNQLAPDRTVLAAQAQAVRDRPAGLCGAHGPAAGMRTQPILSQALQRVGKADGLRINRVAGGRP